MEKTEAERKQVEEPEERLKAMSEASFEAIFLSEKGICLDQNQTAKKMFGYTRAEAIGRHGTEWIVPKDHEQVKINMASGYEKPYEVTALKKDGDTFSAEIQARMTEYQGRSIRITALRDISDRKQAEEALRQSEEKYRDLVNNTADQIEMAYHHRWERALRSFETMEKLIIVGMHGYCLGGALQLALAADIRVSTADCQIGLADHIVSNEDFFTHLDKIACDYLAACSEGTRMSKLVTNQAFDMDYATILQYYFDLQERAQYSPDAEEAKRAYKAKRTPNWQ